MLSVRVLRRQHLRKWKRRNEISRLRHLFMASVAYNFREALYEWAMKDIFKLEQDILYGVRGCSIPQGIINTTEMGGENEEK